MQCDLPPPSRLRSCIARHLAIGMCSTTGVQCGAHPLMDAPTVLDPGGKGELDMIESAWRTTLHNENRGLLLIRADRNTENRLAHCQLASSGSDSHRHQTLEKQTCRQRAILSPIAPHHKNSTVTVCSRSRPPVIALPPLRIQAWSQRGNGQSNGMLSFILSNSDTRTLY